MRLRDARRDHYRKLAHDQGYRSRSVYKLKELNQSYRIIGAGFCVLDLGCAPGGWLQMASKAAGSKGSILGIDTSYVEEIEGVKLLRRDIEDEALIKEILAHFGKKIEAVICDLSPQVSGNWSVDHERQISLNYAAARIAKAVLAPKGNAVFKVFEGARASEFVSHTKELFSRTKLTKPQASRKASSELYLVCLGFKN